MHGNTLWHLAVSPAGRACTDCVECCTAGLAGSVSLVEQGVGFVVQLVDG